MSTEVTFPPKTGPVVMLDEARGADAQKGQELVEDRFDIGKPADRPVVIARLAFEASEEGAPQAGLDGQRARRYHGHDS